jgi:hypothetical protein
MKSSLNIFIVILFGLSISSCSINRKLLGKSKTQYGKIRFYELYVPGEKPYLSKIYV